MALEQEISVELPPPEKVKLYELLPLDKDSRERLNKLIRLYTVILVDHGDRTSNAFRGSSVEARCKTLEQLGLSERLMLLSGSFGGRSIDGTLKDFQHHRIDWETSAIYGSLAGLFCLYYTYVRGFHPGNKTDEFGTLYLSEFIDVVSGLPFTASELLEKFSKARKGDREIAQKGSRPSSLEILRYIFTNKDKVGEEVVSGEPENMDEKLIEDMIHLGIILEPDNDPSPDAQRLVRAFLSKHKRWIQKNSDVRRYLSHHFPTIMADWGKERTGTKIVEEATASIVNLTLDNKGGTQGKVEGDMIILKNISKLIDPLITSEAGTIYLTSSLPGYRRNKQTIMFPVSSLGLSPVLPHTLQIRCGETDIALIIPSALGAFLNQCKPTIRREALAIINSGLSASANSIFELGEFGEYLLIVMKNGDTIYTIMPDDVIDFGAIQPGTWKISYRGNVGGFPDSAALRLETRKTNELDAPNIKPNILSRVIEGGGSTVCRNLFEEKVPSSGLIVVMKKGNAEQVFSYGDIIHFGRLEAGTWEISYRSIEGDTPDSAAVSVEVGFAGLLEKSPSIRENIRQLAHSRGGKIVVKDMFDNPPQHERIKVVFRQGTYEKECSLGTQVNFIDLPVGKYTVQYGDILGRQSVSPGTEIEIGVAIVATVDRVVQDISLNTRATLDSGYTQPIIPEDGLDEGNILALAISLESDASDEMSVRRNPRDNCFDFRGTLDEREICFSWKKDGTVGGKDRMYIEAEYSLLEAGIRKKVDQYEKVVREQEILKMREKFAVPGLLLYDIFEAHLGEKLDTPDHVNFDKLIRQFFGQAEQNKFFYGAGVPLYCKEKLEGFITQLREVGIAAIVEHKSGRGTLSIKLSFTGIPSLSGEIYSEGDQYKILINNACPEELRDEIRLLLEMIFLILGYIGKDFFYGSGGGKSRKKKGLLEEDITGGSKRPKGKRRHMEHLRDMTMYEKVWRSFLHDEGKLCTGIKGGINHGFITYEIHGKNGFKSLNPSNRAIRVVIQDENIGSVADGGDASGDIYGLIEERPRLQKYLILRMLATLREVQNGIVKQIKVDEKKKKRKITPAIVERLRKEAIDVILTEIGFVIKTKDSNGKDPFTGTMRDGFLLFWRGLTPEVRKGFLTSLLSLPDSGNRTGSKQQALNQKIRGERNFINALLDSWKEQGVRMSYRRPHLMKVDTFLELIAEEIGNVDELRLLTSQDGDPSGEELFDGMDALA